MRADKTMKQRALLLAKGFCMGAADVVPGVSGGTMAFILGIYTEFIAAIKSFDLAMLRALFGLDFRTAMSRPHFGFIVPLGLGIGAALLFFTRVVPLPELLVSRPEEVYGLFSGLIAGSIVALLWDLRGLTPAEFILLAAGVIVGYAVFNATPTQTPEAAWFISLSGALAICAMMLPGISGSFVLLILNKYAYILTAIGYFRWGVLLPFAVGAIAGLVLSSRLLSFVLARYYRPTVIFIAGLLVASLSVLWPFRERLYDAVSDTATTRGGSPVLVPDFSPSVLISLALLVTGFAAVVIISRRAAGQTARSVQSG